MATAGETAFADAAQTAYAGNGTVDGAADAVDDAALTSSNSYKLVKSQTGNNLYVETKEYDPLEHHRPNDKAHNKGQGLGFMFCCFGGKSPKNEDTRYGYTIPPTDSAALQEVKNPSC